MRRRGRQGASPLGLDAQQGPDLGHRPVGAKALAPQAARGASGHVQLSLGGVDGGGVGAFQGDVRRGPCRRPVHGVGTWQRNPHARWTTTLEDVAELAAVQAGLLGRAATSVKPGGRLLYSVCTLTRSETSAVADGFEAAHRDFEPAPIAIAAGQARITLLPQDLDANGMFIASWRRVR